MPKEGCKVNNKKKNKKNQEKYVTIEKSKKKRMWELRSCSRGE